MLQARSLILSAFPTNLHGKETHPRFFSSLMALLSLLNLVLLASAQVRPLIVRPPEPPPWIFAAPTGATKVTVYRDPSPSSYTTGYVVLWGTTQGGPYPNTSPELPLTPRHYDAQGLQANQTYYFVVKAVFRGRGVVYSNPSEEDSAVPHVGAIPWDTQDVNQIIPAVRNALGASFNDNISVLSPEGYYYTEISGGREMRTTAPFRYNTTGSTMEGSDGGLLMPMQRHEENPQPPDKTGPYRRIKTGTQSSCIGAQGQFYLPPPGSGINRYISIDATRYDTTRDTPHVYFGIAYAASSQRNIDIEGGLSFHPAGRGVRRNNQEEGAQANTPPPNYDRWLPYMRFRNGKDSQSMPVVGDGSHPSNHISYGVNWQDAPYGFIAEIDLHLMDEPRYRTKSAVLLIRVWRVLLDQDPFFVHWFVGATDVPQPATSPRTRRIISMAQKESDTGTNGWLATQSFFAKLGVGYQPLFDIGDLNPVQVFCGGWQLWTATLTGEVRNFPTDRPLVTVEPPIAAYYREVVRIDMRR